MLYECHGHIILDGLSYPAAMNRHKNGPDEMFLRKNLKICAENGITFYRDGGDKHMVSVLAKRLAPEYGIDYRTPVYIIHKKGMYGGMFGRSFENLGEYRSLVREAGRLGADFVKITVSGMLDFAGGGGITGQTLTYSELREMVKIASGEGFAVMAHVNGAVNIKNALEAGVHSIEHGFYIDSDALQIASQTGTVWVPTCVAVSNLLGTGRFDDSVLEKIMSGHKAALSRASGMDVLIASGSDAGAAGVMPERGAREEFEYLSRLGINCDAGNRKISDVFVR